MPEHLVEKTIQQVLSSDPPLTLEQCPVLSLLNREDRLEELHKKFFQPFYVMAESFFIEASRDVKLSCRAWCHPRSHSTLLLIGGRNESHAKYAETAYDFFTRGYNVFTYDHRGQGFSQRELLDTQIGWVESLQTYINDLAIFHDRVVVPRKKGELFVVAHSMGASISALWMSQTHATPKAVSFTAPMIQLVLKPYPAFIVSLMVNAGIRAGRDKTYIPGGTDFVSEGYGFDLTNSAPRRNWNRQLFAEYPQIRLGAPSYNWLREALSVERRLKAARFPENVNSRVLVWQAGADQVVKPNAHKVLSRARGNCQIVLEEKSQHELLQETDDIRSRVIGRTLSFFDSARELGV